jgi:DNA repair protein RadC
LKYEIPHLPVGDLRTVEHHDEISPVQMSSNIKAYIGTHAHPMHNLTRSETDEEGIFTFFQASHLVELQLFT